MLKKKALVNEDKLDAVQIFGTGPRNCIGRKYVRTFLQRQEPPFLKSVYTPRSRVSSLAYTEMRLVLAHIIYKFDMELADESKAAKDGLRGRGPSSYLRLGVGSSTASLEDVTVSSG